MDKARFERAKQHGAALAIASHLYKRGLIADAEHRKLALELQKECQPAAGPRQKAMGQKEFWERRILAAGNIKTK